jgi:hypothetical protein
MPHIFITLTDSIPTLLGRQTTQQAHTMQVIHTRVMDMGTILIASLMVLTTLLTPICKTAHIKMGILMPLLIFCDIGMVMFTVMAVLEDINPTFTSG